MKTLPKLHLSNLTSKMSDSKQKSHIKMLPHINRV